jgi:DNA-binding PadR family transcriptional regulator
VLTAAQGFLEGLSSSRLRQPLRVDEPHASRLFGLYTECIVAGVSLGHALLGLLEEQPCHGYELKHLYDDRFGPSQSVKFGQVYTTLARLRRDGLVDISAVESGGGPDRKLYLVTPTGVADLERWLSEAEPPETFGRKVLFTKVVLALMSGRAAAEILDSQRAAHLVRMRELTERKRDGDLSDALASDFDLFHLEADLRWIELAGTRVERLRSQLKERP